MAGNIEFGDEQEARQAEILSGRMIEDIATQHSIVGERVTKVRYTAPSWDANVMVVDDLNIEFASGLVISAPTAYLDPSRAAGGFREALRAENERQAATADRGGSIRAVGERLADHPGPELDQQGDPVEHENPVSYPQDPPQIEGTDISYPA